MANFKDIMAMCLDGEAMLPSLRRWAGGCLMVCVWESIPHKEISQNDYCGTTKSG